MEKGPLEVIARELSVQDLVLHDGCLGEFQVHVQSEGDFGLCDGLGVREHGEQFKLNGIVNHILLELSDEIDAVGEVLI